MENPPTLTSLCVCGHHIASHAGYPQNPTVCLSYDRGNDFGEKKYCICKQYTPQLNDQ